MCQVGRILYEDHLWKPRLFQLPVQTAVMQQYQIQGWTWCWQRPPMQECSQQLGQVIPVGESNLEK